MKGYNSLVFKLINPNLLITKFAKCTKADKIITLVFIYNIE